MFFSLQNLEVLHGAPTDRRADATITFGGKVSVLAAPDTLGLLCVWKGKGGGVVSWKSFAVRIFGPAHA